MKRLALIFLVSCSFPATPSGPDKLVTCVDTRDGETFSFNTGDVENLRVGYLGAETIVTVIDSEGRRRYLKSSMEAWLKCQ